MSLEILFFASLGILMVILAMPMIRGKVAPNSWYGFRTKKTLSDPEIWYPANTYAGKWLLAYGILLIAASLLLPWLLPNLTSDAYTLLFSIITLGGITIVILFCWHYIKHL